MRAPVVVSGLVVVLALSTACGSASEAPGVGGSASASATPTPPPPSPPPSPSPSASASPSTEPLGDGSVHPPSGPYDLVLRTVSVVKHDGHDRVVLRFAGKGKPGWVARYVKKAVLEGSGQVVDLKGSAILRFDVTGMPTLDDDDLRPVRTELGGTVVDVHTVPAFEGSGQVFLGLRGGRTTYDVVRRTGPSRLVLDLG